MFCLQLLLRREGERKSGAASLVCRLSALLQVVEGKIKEKEEAKDIYDDAIASGHGAYLLEQVETKEVCVRGCARDAACLARTLLAGSGSL